MPFTSEYEVGDKILQIEQRADETTDGSKLNANSGTVWDAAVVLINYISQERVASTLKGKRGIDLGCGTGIVGIAASSLGMECTLTDYEDVCVLAQTNVDLNQADGNLTAPCTVATLDWNDASTALLESMGLQDLDYILCSDLVCMGLYVSAPLIVLLKLLLQNASATCLMSHELREEGNVPAFLAAAKEAGLAVSRLPEEALHPQYRCEEISILEIRLA